IASTRTTEFEEQFRTATSGHGLDVVLHSLAGEFTDATLRSLAPAGRMIDIGKTDIRDPQQIAADYPGIGYYTFDLTAAAPDRVAPMLTRLMELFRARVLNPLPLSAFPVSHAAEAFRHMSRAAHTGKLVLSLHVSFDPDATVLITGGTGAL